MLHFPLLGFGCEGLRAMLAASQPLLEGLESVSV